jgi:hypothetical protein
MGNAASFRPLRGFNIGRSDACRRSHASGICAVHMPSPTPAMPLHPQCRKLLDTFVAAWPEIDYARVDAPELRALFSGPSPFTPGDEVASIRNLENEGPRRALRMRAYRPRAHDAALPRHAVLPPRRLRLRPCEWAGHVCPSLGRSARRRCGAPAAVPPGLATKCNACNACRVRPRLNRSARPTLKHFLGGAGHFPDYVHG